MADDKNRRGSPDSKRLDKSEPYEVAYARSKRATPERKAMLKKAASPAGKKTTRKTAAKSGSSRPSSTATRTKASRSASPRAKSGSASASPAMQRTNAAPARSRAAKPTVRATPKPPKEQKTAENTAPRTMKTADAVDLLTDDHLQVSALFKKYEKLTRQEAPADERQALAQQICAMLKAHTTIEEEIFYPAARRAGIDADLLDEADVEHASAKDLIAQLEASGPDSDRYDARVTVLGEYITHHVVEEHTEMFPKCRRAGMDLVALRETLEARKTQAMAGLGQPLAGDARSQGEAESPGLLARIGDSLFSSSKD